MDANREGAKNSGGKKQAQNLHLITGRSQVPTCAGAPESDHSGN